MNNGADRTPKKEAEDRDQHVQSNASIVEHLLTNQIPKDKSREMNNN
ncbi:hypothetical protein [Paenibacillus flagellatus]|nr:hypothetical protein [Paenibacillus flagellatus]